LNYYSESDIDYKKLGITDEEWDVYVNRLEELKNIIE
jgi:hypothetical protein